MGESSFMCEIEDVPFGEETFSVSMNGADYVGSVLFEGLQQLSVYSVHPTSGSMQGRTLLNVRGLHFEGRLKYDCRFAESSTLATVMSSTMLECESPSARGQGKWRLISNCFQRRSAYRVCLRV